MPEHTSILYLIKSAGSEQECGGKPFFVIQQYVGGKKAACQSTFGTTKEEMEKVISEMSQPFLSKN